MIQYINQYLPSTEKITESFREEIPIYPKIAIRELVANAIIHQDFLENGSILIEIFEDRIEISNPGTPLIEISRFVDHNPQSRNEIFANFMRRLKICEERGSGIDKVVLQCEMFQLPAPKFIAGSNYTKVILFGPKTYGQMSKEDKLRACYLHACLKYVNQETMTNNSLRERFGIDKKNYSMVSRLIKECIEMKMIKVYNTNSTSNKNAQYVPIWA